MPLTLDLPDDLEATLTEEAARLGMSVCDYALHLLTITRPPIPEVRNGADLIAFWRAEGLVGSRPDILDSQAEARRLREQAQHNRLSWAGC